jgi:hypothetical protein
LLLPVIPCHCLLFIIPLTNNDREWQATARTGNDKQKTMTGNDN